MTFLVGDTLSAPPPGSTATGDLYVDLQTKTMWMGVDTAVDPTGAVLISDIVSIQPAINAALEMANEYTDIKLTGYTLIGHHHVAADVTDFDAAVHAAVSGTGGGGGGVFPGFIGMYSGPMSNIGTGIYAGWTLCDGTNGTPDLRDKFVLGAGNRAPGIANTLDVATTNVIAAHKHNIQQHVLTLAETPVHNHAVSASGSGSGGTDAQGNHNHPLTVFAGDGGRFDGVGGNGVNSVIGTAYTGVTGNHSHNVSVSVNVSGATDNRGSGGGHNHEEDLAGAHSHTTTQAQLREAMPYLTLAFIMKL